MVHNAQAGVAADRGGEIFLGTRRAAGLENFTGARLFGARENATDGNTASYFTISTFTSGTPGTQTEAVRWNSSQAMSLEGKVSEVANIATEGTFGVPTIVDVVTTNAQTPSIGATTVTNSTPTGQYRVSVYLETDVLDLGLATVSATLAWEGDDGENITQTTSVLAMTVATSNLHQTFFINHTGTGVVSIQYSTTFAAGGGTDSYLIRVITERLN